MILMDFSQIFQASLHVSFAGQKKPQVDEDMLRHMALNSIRFNVKQYRQKYGELVLCFDSRKNWRKDVFPYYKARRALSKEESEIDWNEVYRVISVLKQELRDHFPYKTLEIEGLEADDIIGTLCHKYGQPLMSDPILIISGDKDYRQLHTYGNINQWDPVQKRFIDEQNPERYLFDLICRGDGGDDVPNIRSAENSFMLKIRAKPITNVMLDKWLAEGIPEDMKARFEMNKLMIDLSLTPEDLKVKVYEAFDAEKRRPPGLLNYFMDKGLRNLMEFIGDF